MELRLLPHFVDDPLKAMRKAFETFYNNSSATIPALLFLTFPFIILNVNALFGNLVTAVTIMILSPIILSGLMWQLVIGTSWRSFHTDFIEGLKKNYVRLGLAYGLITIVLLILTYVFVVGVSLALGFDSDTSTIGLSDTWHSNLALLHFFAVIIGFTVLATIFQFFDVIIVTEKNTSIINAFKKSYYVFRESPMDVFTYMTIRGFLLIVTLGSPVLLFFLASDDMFILITAVLAILISFPIAVVIGVAYHIHYYDVRTEHINFNKYIESNDESSDSDE